MEEYRVFYSRSVPYKGIINIPDTGKEKYPAAILVHGHSRQKNDGLDRLAEVLAENEIASFRYDMPGCGSSRNNSNDYLDDWVRSLRDAVTYLSYDPKIDDDRIATAGISLGGSTVVVAAALEDRIKCTASMAAVADFKKNFGGSWAKEGWELCEKDKKEAVLTGVSGVMTNPYMCGIQGEAEKERIKVILQEQWDGFMNNVYVSIESVNDLMRTAPGRYAPLIKNPILYLHGSADECVLHENAYYLYENTPQTTEKELVFIDGCDHNMPIDPHREEVFAEIVKWYKKYL